MNGFIVWIVFCIQAIRGQSGIPGWTAFLSNSYLASTKVAVDQQGNIYAAGQYYSPWLNITEGSGTQLSKPYGLVGDRDATLLKFSATGKFIWAARISSMYSDDELNAVATDASGNVVVVGNYGTGPCNIYDGEEKLAKTFTGLAYAYVLKFASNGSLIWTSRAKGSDNNVNYFSAVATDNLDAVIVTGYFTSSIATIYNPQSQPVRTFLNLGTGADVWVVKYQHNGTLAWGLRMGGTVNDRATGIGADSTRAVYISGHTNSDSFGFFDELNRFMGILPRSGSSSCGFVVKLSRDGRYSWSVYFDGSGEDYARQLTVDPLGNVIVGGEHDSSTLFIYDFTQAEVGTLDKSGGDPAAFIIKFNSKGIYLWSAKIDGNSFEWANSVASDPDGNVVVAGYFSSNPLNVYDQYGNAIRSLAQVGPFTSYVVKYFSNGSVAWAIRATSSEVYGVGCDSFGNVIVAGHTRSEASDIALNQLDVYGPQNILIWSSGRLVPRGKGFIMKVGPQGLWNIVDAPAIFSGSTASSSALSTSSDAAQLSSATLMIGELTLDQRNEYFTATSSKLSVESSGDPNWEFNITPLIIPLVIFVLMIIVLLVLVIICRTRYARTKKLRMYGTVSTASADHLKPAEDAERSTIGSSMSQYTAMTTLQVTSHEISIPAYLELKFGVDYGQDEFITKGGGGSLYKCSCLSVDLDRLCHGDPLVLKRIAVNLSGMSEQRVRSFWQEVSLMHRFRDQPGFCRMYGYSTNPVTMVMKYYPLSDLSHYIKGRRRAAERFTYSKKQVISILRRVTTGIAFMHSSGVVHSDIKPANILLDVINDELIPVVSDFGVSRIISKEALQVHAFEIADRMGASISYAAPDVLFRLRMRKKVVDADLWKAGDTYALAVTILVMCQRREAWVKLR